MLTSKPLAFAPFIALLACTSSEVAPGAPEPGGDSTAPAAVATSAPAPSSVTANPAFRLLKAGYRFPTDVGGDAPGRRAPFIEIATTNDRYASLWKIHVDEAAPPSVDFSKESVIFLLVGPRSSAGYAVQPHSVEIPSERKAIVTASINEPAGDGAAAQVITAPYAAIAVSSPKITEADWKTSDGQLLATRVPE